MKKLSILFSLMLLIMPTMNFAQESFSTKEQNNHQRTLIKQGFPANLLKNYTLTPIELPQLLRLLAIYNTYEQSHQLTLGYDAEVGDWVLTFAGKTDLYWAKGRILPKSELAHVDKYRSYISYQWSEVPADMRTWPLERLQRFQNSTNPNVQRTRTTYHGQFHHLLYGGYDQKSIEAQLIEMEFLGTRLKMNKLVAPALKRVEESILKEKARDASLQAFLNTLTNSSSYYWRNIAGTNSISYHSYGIAIDINPIKTTKPIYWLWERARNPEWFLVAPEDRWQIHPSVLRAFFQEGFLWGGSWPQYDIMHFEYRPELKELARLNELFK
ncbi:M15 family metallopeptidase [Entomospira culicis]|uniref:M15 family metallopeptidase n=1 Tax=Entomospira culicis TaxID=2719989 RepID=A0A968KVE6_9SPIO|nr:M15 family metallopeptidase [Entomospira culicis]NIZ18808.1 M15 family metallopeptidase [Entomospira culicis]NIZ69023.1 M15 family metallopeptidase [Entomospira culicis]WDI37613.1 M15 family metallopeptidase [Entomospira culicis]WDI39241.1 M15 family metallopeptidase [Entomospira culicis]